MFQNRGKEDWSNGRVKMRFDRFLSLRIFHLLLRVAGNSDKLRIPILMYHSISDEPESGHPYKWINTSPKRFAEHMTFLLNNNYKVIDLPEAVRLISTESAGFPNPPTFHDSSFPQKMVVLTFDDGYRDFYTHAFDILKKFGFGATVFLPTSVIDNGRKPGLKGKEHLGWKEVGELQKEGILFGSHTVNHPQLKLLGKKEIEYEVKHSKECIEDRIGRLVDSFAYPNAFPQEDGEFKKYIENILERCGYKHGVTTIIGRSNKQDNVFLLKRLPVNSGDDLRFFKAKLEGGYDWLIHPQHLYKSLYKIIRD
jgi:peptidoglycan/xylan/chitin deacetylase (PgdA/CDA1 family)